jgi:hypothetical protein
MFVLATGKFAISALTLMVLVLLFLRGMRRQR